MKVYGLTGGIASGKSTIARLLRARGVPVIDADEIARRVVEPGTPGLEQVVEAFGPGVLRPEGTLDREALGRQVFSDEAQRRRLNAILHPLVQTATAEEVMRLAEAGTPLAVLDIPLLFEARDPAAFDGVIVVFVDEATQLARLMARNGFTREEAEARIRSQLALEEKAKRATWVIDNRGTPEETEAQLELLLARLRYEAAESP